MLAFLLEDITDAQIVDELVAATVCLVSQHRTKVGDCTQRDEPAKEPPRSLSVDDVRGQLEYVTDADDHRDAIRQAIAKAVTQECRDDATVTVIVRWD